MARYIIDRVVLDFTGPMPAVPAIPAAALAQYRSDSALLRDHYQKAAEFWRVCQDRRDHMAQLEQQNQWRYSKVRARQIERTRGALLSLYDTPISVIAHAVNDACQRVQAFRQRYYGYCWGQRGQRHWVANQVRMHGHFVSHANDYAPVGGEIVL